VRGEWPEIDTWRRELAKLYAPRRLVLAIPTDASGLPEALADKVPGKSAIAYICHGSTCSAPLDSLEALLSALHSHNGGR